MTSVTETRPATFLRDSSSLPGGRFFARLSGRMLSMMLGQSRSSNTRPSSSVVRAPVGNAEVQGSENCTLLASRHTGGRRFEPSPRAPKRTYRPFGWWFQIRWRESLGNPECPYLHRWTLIVLGYSIRLHHWMKSDDRRFFHDHASTFISIVLRGRYWNVSPEGRTEVKAGSIWCSDETFRHYLEIPPAGAWTLLLCGRRKHRWGFFVNGKKMNPGNYFRRYGIIQDEKYQ